MGSAENQVTAACFRYLQLRGAFVWRNQSRTINMPGVGGKLRPMFFGLPGSPDILGMLAGGRFVGVECKQPLGPKGGDSHSRQSDDQKAFQRECERVGGLYVLARSVDDVIEALDKLDREASPARA